MNQTVSFILSGKYQILRTLGSGASGTVYLARHHSLESERAIKVIPKTSSDQLSVLTEARLLKSMCHPGIPMIYDIEEDDENYYLVEEYIHGESLEDYLLHQTFISQAFFFHCCIQLCEIYRYLHSFLKEPVLYQDLKPAHLIVCGDQLKLIDFGVTSPAAGFGNNFKHYGNAAFSAPENAAPGELSVQSDVFSIGRMMEYLSGFLDASPSRTIQQIIQKATDPLPASRYETVEALEAEIQKESQKIGQPRLLHTIAVVGSFPGCGATHFSLSLVSALNFMGYRTCYFEKNESGSMQKMACALPALWEKDGRFHYGTFQGYPNYGPGIVLPETTWDITVTDYGCTPDLTEIERADLLVYLCADAPWHRSDVFAQSEFLDRHRDHLTVICSPGTRHACKLYAKELQLPIYPYFYDPDPFAVTREKMAFASRLLNRKGRTSLFSILKRIIRKCPAP
jgi:serine/threonine-protein kinase